MTQHVHEESVRIPAFALFVSADQSMAHSSESGVKLPIQGVAYQRSLEEWLSANTLPPHPSVELAPQSSGGKTVVVCLRSLRDGAIVSIVLGDAEVCDTLLMG